MGKFSTLLKNTSRALGLSFKYLPKLTWGILAVTIIGGLAPLLQSKILGNIVNQIVKSASHAGTTSSIIFLALTYAAIWAGIRIVGVTELYLGKVWRDEAGHALDLLIFKKRTEIDLGHYENPEFQNLLIRAFSQGSSGPILEIIQNQFVIISNLALAIISSFVAASIGWNIYAIILLASMPSFIVQRKYGYKVWGIWAEHSDRQKIYAHMRYHVTSRTGVTQIKLLQNGKKILDTINNALRSFIEDNKKLDTERFIFQSLAAIISATGFGFSLWLIIRQVLLGSISIGTLVFVISALGALVGSINTLLARLAIQIEKNLYLSDIFQVLDTKPYIKRPEHPVHLHLTTPPEIEFKNVSFKYAGREDWILRDVNLHISPREKVALVGMNGAGKSTLIKLLSRIYDPTEGEIFINGVNLKEIDLDEWSSYLSVLLQDYLTYDFKAKEAIAMGRVTEELDESHVQTSASFSGADEFIENWEHKYDQQLGKEYTGGIEPSKGQQQRLALARTIYRNALIMVLDEPTAAIDALSEMKIFEQMENAVGNNTLIVITHRFNTTQNVDKIIVLDHGTVKETGTHPELLKHNGLYKEMFESQAKAFREKKEDQE
ncbi:ABC transporter ATP-binding protein/permease [Candidatus Parcubacteria bacterium]|nr:ABC transporter ATP-binding protein/permease [Candidatus Parcubacteria bacterium]